LTRIDHDVDGDLPDLMSMPNRVPTHFTERGRHGQGICIPGGSRSQEDHLDQLPKTPTRTPPRAIPSGVIIGDDSVMVIDTTATPAMAQDLIARIRSVTDKPIKYVVLSHYHAVRVLGASAYFKGASRSSPAAAPTR
jgi:glyoxylase-like metal-dependent hydrolase (beta-lactamase superfamily II)